MCRDLILRAAVGAHQDRGEGATRPSPRRVHGLPSQPPREAPRGFCQERTFSNTSRCRPQFTLGFALAVRAVGRDTHGDSARHSNVTRGIFTALNPSARRLALAAPAPAHCWPFPVSTALLFPECRRAGVTPYMILGLASFIC